MSIYRLLLTKICYFYVCLCFSFSGTIYLNYIGNSIGNLCATTIAHNESIFSIENHNGTFIKSGRMKTTTTRKIDIYYLGETDSLS